MATLDGGGKVPVSQLPSYVDDVLEFADFASFPGTGETGKIYIAIDTNFSYRWTGSVYVDITSKVDSVNSQTGAVTLDADDIAEGATNKYFNGKNTDDLPEGATNKYNATHTGEITGSAALTLDNTSITNKTTVGAASGDFVLISDTSDSGNLKKVNVDDFLTGTGSSDLNTTAITNASSPYTALGTDDVILVDTSGGNVTINLPAASSNDKKVYVIKKTDAANIITVDGNASETIEGATTALLHTVNETMKIVCDATEWHIIHSYTNTAWVDAGVNDIDATVTDPTKGTTAVDKFRWRRVGKHMEVNIEYQQTAAGSAGSGDYLFNMSPSGYTIDTGVLTSYATAEGQGGNWEPKGTVVGTFTGSSSEANMGGNHGSIIPYDTNNVRAFVQYGSHNTNTFRTVPGSASGGMALSNTTVNYVINMLVPITDWRD